MSISLDENAVHIWLAFESVLDDPANADRFLALMSEDELARDRRFLVEPARRLHRLARALQRDVLSSYLPGVTPHDLRFATGDSGRPSLAAPFDTGGLDFNLAHTRGLAVMAVSRGAVIGVDVEIYDKKVPLEVARRFFSPVEVEGLHALPPAAQPRRFLRLWTLKESYLKAIGTGIAGGLDSVTFRIDDAGACTFERAADPAAASWAFSQFDVGDQHVLALAHRSVRGSGPNARISWHVYRGSAASSSARVVPLMVRDPS